MQKFSYHHNILEAYYPIAVAILDAGLTCSASIPCPAEMGASIHINGTGSSIVDTVFVCRSAGKVPRRWIAETPEEIASLVRADLDLLHAGKVIPTRGDMRCIVYGHLVRLAIWRLRQSWDRTKLVQERLSSVTSHMQTIGGFAAIEQHLSNELLCAPRLQSAMVREGELTYGASEDEISF